MGIQRYGAEPGETYGESEGWLVAYDDHLSDKATALARQREGIAEMMRRLLYKSTGPFTLEDRMDLVTAIRAYGQEEE